MTQRQKVTTNTLLSIAASAIALGAGTSWHVGLSLFVGFFALAGLLELALDK